MKKGSVIILLVLVFFGCGNEENNNCSTSATVRNLIGLDGCGWVFELEDGTKLEPFLGIPRCGFGKMGGKMSEDPLDNFEFVDGKKVFIDYETVPNVVSICMVGPTVKITCISEAAFISEE